MSVLWACASRREAAAFSSGGPALLELGVGKARAAATLARRLAREPDRLVVLFGVAGAYRGSGLTVGEMCVVTSAVFADEGVVQERGFTDLAELGFGSVSAAGAHDGVRSRALAAFAGGLRCVRAATVSTCSGRDDLAAAYAARSGAEVETMESAAVALACAAAGVPLVELRCVSNLCGDRARGAWDLDAAVARLGAVLREVVEGGLFRDG